ncbi:hypothetical protein [Pseudomonas chlororaphis]|uniref:hypothetical protein n=1 Tax=Pseudomonas chlororaphis TaxID=587753 RepID=UPI001B314E29|nr:hypothetical protein [Pseudomonas chlororaphis]MBP5060363.1 hypothetical protein [Pseudomonas chlororaphis]MBP5144071.1 hypothetical protein [Pseudomonas chlororaphis]MBP5144209.1 hypothetical protein [Pseudomonas chlororaphis]QTT98328.1 hypothetical protein HUT26_03220 [Pseudomonas chlororaphis]
MKIVLSKRFIRLGSLLALSFFTLMGCTQGGSNTLSGRLLVTCSSSMPTEAKPCEQKAKTLCNGDAKLYSVKPPMKIKAGEGISQHPVVIAYKYDTIYQCNSSSMGQNSLWIFK